MLSDDALDSKLQAGKNSNTEKSEKKAHKAFVNFLKQNGPTNLDYWYFEEPGLDKYLTKFWLGVRKSDIEDASDNEDDMDKKDRLYSANTLHSF